MLGDMRGVVAVAQGLPTVWREDGIFISQMPQGFGRSGAEVFVTEASPTALQRWSFTFGPQPRSRLVLRKGLSDLDGFDFTTDGQKLILRTRHEVRLATLSEGPDGTVALGPRLPLSRPGMLTPVLLGDEVLYYREGAFTEGGCGAPGTFRQYNLATKQERVWRTDDACSTFDAFEGKSEASRSVFFRKGYPVATLFQYALNTGVVTKVMDGMEKVSDVSSDGRALLVAGPDALVVFDLLERKVLWSKKRHVESAAYGRFIDRSAL